MIKLIVALVVGFLVGLVLCVLTGYFIITSGLIPARQDEPSSDLEKWAAHQSLRATIKKEATMTSPIEPNEENLAAGVKIYGENCSGCHGAPLNKTPSFGNAYSPSAPFFANGDTVTDDPEAKIYWKIDHGIRFTGMPSFNKLLSEKEMWQVTLFLKHADKLPKAAEDAWQATK